MSMIKHLMELAHAVDQDLFNNVYDHIQGRLRRDDSLNIEDAISDFLGADGQDLNDEQVRQLNHSVRAKLNMERMRHSSAARQ